jgi:3-oxoacyl-(acyl-carrier-protein) synthase
MSPLVSPTTTLGNISSWLAYDLGIQGLNISHSITCSTALHSILNACAWINSGFVNTFIAGGSEAPLTNFTISQMRALGIYSTSSNPWICSPLKSNHTQNSMVLGEGAAIFCLEKNKPQKALAKIIGIGYATEKIQHHASLSSDAECIKKSMKMALESSQLKTIDAIVMHAPGTLQGDQSELKAIHSVFGEKTPHLISTKFQSGHTLGASGGISLDLAIEMLIKKQYLCFPYQTNVRQNMTSYPKTILVNAVGFGGNAVSIIIQKAD